MKLRHVILLLVHPLFFLHFVTLFIHVIHVRLFSLLTTSATANTNIITTNVSLYLIYLPLPYCTSLIYLCPKNLLVPFLPTCTILCLIYLPRLICSYVAHFVASLIYLLVSSCTYLNHFTCRDLL